MFSMTIERSSFIHRDNDFTDWLATEEQLYRDNPDHYLNTNQVTEAHTFLLQNLERGNSIEFSTLARIQTMYPQGLLNGRPEDIKTLTSAFEYAAMRLPTQVFSDDISEINLSNDTEYIMSVPHASETKPYDLMRKHPPARARWYLKQKHEDGSVRLVFEVRDADPADPTDSFELLSWLGSLEQIRLTTKQLQQKGESIVPLQHAMRRIYRKHITSEMDMLHKKLTFHHTVLETNGSTDIDRIDREISQMSARIEVLEAKLLNIDSLADSLFKNWLSRSDDLKITLAYQGQIRLNKLGEHDQTAAKMATKLIKERLIERQIDEPTDVLFGNDYSIRIFLSLGLFNDSEFDQLRSVFLPTNISKSVRASNPEWYSQLDQVKMALKTLSGDAVATAAEKFFLVQQLSLYGGNDQNLKSLRLRLFSPKTFQKIGLIRLVGSSESPLADPIDVLEPQSISTELMANLPTPVREVLKRVVQNNQVIMSVPYTLGNLTAQTLEAFSQTFEQPFNIAFMGKVGNASASNDSISVGELTLPTKVYNQFNEEPLAVINTINQFLVESGLPIHQAVMMTTLALTFQEPGEMEALMESLPEGKALTLDVELYHLMSWLQTYLPTLSEEQRQKHKVVLRYYISDKTILPRYFDQEAHGQDKISQSLGMRGSIPLFIALFDILNQLAEKN